MSDILFSEKAFRDLCEWSERDPKIFKKIQRLIKEAARTPFSGTGKPEPLKENLGGCWSRRITEEHRLVYRTKNDVLEIVSCKNHYGA